jgi:hypothetical protein
MKNKFSGLTVVIYGRRDLGKLASVYFLNFSPQTRYKLQKRSTPNVKQGMSYEQY